MTLAWSPVPNPPATMLRIDRFIASAINFVRMLPEAPTSAPAMMSPTLLMTNPAIATAVPVKALRSEITTGMSAPPIGMTMITPMTSEASAIPIRVRSLFAPERMYPVPAHNATASTRLITRPAGTTIGRDGMRPCSLPTATTEPDNVTAPITTSRMLVTEIRAAIVGTWKIPASRTKSATATSAAAPPPTALNRLTSCGIAVISTERAR